MKLTKEQIMVAEGMIERGVSMRQAARQLGVCEGAVRYRLARRREGERRDGRAGKATSLDGYEDAVHGVLERLDDVRLTGTGRPAQDRQVFEVLCPGVRVRGQLQERGASSRAPLWAAGAAGAAAGGDTAGRAGAA